MKNDVLFKDPVSRTLLITLKVKAEESVSKHPLFKDSSAVNVLSRIPDEELDFKMLKPARIGTAIRVKFFDDELRKFAEEHDTPVFINAGCGLDDRFSRTDCGKGVYVNIDLPEVSTIRQELLPQKHERVIEISCDILSKDWMFQIKNKFPHGDFAILAEGVLMYLTKKQVKTFFKNIEEVFSKATVIFDACDSHSLKMLNKNSAMKDLNATLTWHMDEPSDIESWSHGIKHIKTKRYFDSNFFKWGIYSIGRFFKSANGSTMNVFKIQKDA